MNGFTDLQTSEKHLRFSITQRLHLLQNFLYGYDTKKVIRTRKIYNTIDKKLIYVFEIYKYWDFFTDVRHYSTKMSI